ncbi:MAG: epimerase [Pseudomonadota bacterium]|nr:epimerase [Pseudomonadota bacterium]
MTQEIPMHRPDTTPGKTALILGASGKFGRNAAQAFADRSWQIRRFDRKRDDLMLAAQGVDVIVNGWNPPSYNLWEKELLPAHQSVARAARASGATVIIPGNVYNFGPDAPRGWSETTPHLATNPLGRLRIAVEQGYRDAQVQTIVLRAGDFWDTARSQNWFDLFIAKKAHRGVMSYPGDLNTPHAWAFLPDLARAAVLLAERRETLTRFEDVPFRGYTLTGRALADAMGHVLDRPVRARRMSWLPLQLARPLMPMLKGVFEMRYLWGLPHHLEGGKLARLCPDFVPTPMDQALAQALEPFAPEAIRGRPAPA